MRRSSGHDMGTCGRLSLLLGAGWALRERQLAHRRRASAAELTRARVMSATAEHLHRISALIAAGADTDAVCATVAETAMTLFDAHLALVAQLDENTCGQLRGLAHDPALTGMGYPTVGEGTHFHPHSAVGLALARGRTVRVPEGTSSLHGAILGERIATPIMLADGTWGAVALAAAPGATLPGDIEQPLERFAALVGLAIGNADARARLVAQAGTDSLTGLANRRRFHEHLDREIARARRHAHPLSLILADVDRFKAVNDSLGHLAGDTVLTDVARRLETILRAETTLARIGGDEFALILPETSLTEAREVARRAHACVRAVPVLDDLRVTLSIGVAPLGPEETSEDLRRAADRALYAVKHSGRDSVLCADA